MIKVIKPGTRSSLQDGGRFGFRNQGVPLSGAMDQHAFLLANHLVGNKTQTPVIEFMLRGPELVFTVSTHIALTGADFQAKLNNVKIENLKRIFVPAGSTLSFGHSLNGVFGYLAVEGGLNAPQVLKSYSYYPDIAETLLLKKDAELKIIPFKQKSKRNSRVSPLTEKFEGSTLEVYPGPEFGRLTREMQKNIGIGVFKVGPNSSRMGYEILHSLNLKAEEIITAPVQPGTIQLTPSGHMIALMRDAQTTGGYARIFQLSEGSINKLAQKRIHEEFRFKLVD